MIDYIILTITFLTLILTYFLWYSERKKELSRLKALFDHLIFIRKSAQGHEKYLKDLNLPLPSWPVANIDLNFYLTQLNYKIRREFSLCSEKTRRLKKELIGTYEKIKNINYLWEKEIENSKTSSNSNKLITDLKTNTYYSDLYGMIENAIHEIKRIIS